MKSCHESRSSHQWSKRRLVFENLSLFRGAIKIKCVKIITVTMAEEPSTSKTLDTDALDETSFENEGFKGEFTNALLYANSIYDNHGLLTKEPPAKISSVSMAMADSISNAVIDILNDSYVTTEDDLILFDDSDSEGAYEEVCTFSFRFVNITL